MCRVTGVPFNTVAWKKKKVYGFSSMAGRGNRSDAGLKNKFKPRTFMANDDLHGVDCSLYCAVDTLFLEILNYTESLISKVRNGFECKANTNIQFYYVGLYKRPKFFNYLGSLLQKNTTTLCNNSITSISYCLQMGWVVK